MRLARIGLTVALVVLIAGCSGPPAPDSAGEGVDGAGSPAGSRIAAGLHDMGDGRAEAVGTLSWVDVEGGFWAVTGSPEDSGESSDVIAVLVGSEAFQERLESAEGQTVSVRGSRLEGASIRMAGPELQIESFDVIDDTQGAAE